MITIELLPKSGWQRSLVRTLYILPAITLAFLFLDEIISILVPFIPAALLGWLLQSPCHSLKKRLHAPLGVISIMMVGIVLFFLCFVAFLTGNQLITEGQRLFVRLSENSEGILAKVSDTLNALGNRFPFIYEYTDREVVTGTVTEVIKNVITSLSTWVANTLGAFVKRIPDIALSLVVFVIASFYFTLDFGRLTEGVRRLLGEKGRLRAHKVAVMIKHAAAGYIKAYALLWLITFSVLFLGFIILRVEYATTLAIVIALLDMLPVIGTGTVLIPWGIICIAGGGYRRGIGVLVLFACVTVIREIAEAKVIGRCIGMHPLLTLAAMYAGYRLLGVAGILLLPLALNLAREMTGTGTHKSTKIYNSTIDDKTC